LRQIDTAQPASNVKRLIPSFFAVCRSLSLDSFVYVSGARVGIYIKSDEVAEADIQLLHPALKSLGAGFLTANSDKEDRLRLKRPPPRPWRVPLHLIGSEIPEGQE
jgi:hypothetical protein